MARHAPHGQAPFATKSVNLDAPCGLCHISAISKGNDMLACDGCDTYYHQKCALVKVIPHGTWFCPACSNGLGPHRAEGLATERARALARGVDAFLRNARGLATQTGYSATAKRYHEFCAGIQVPADASASAVLYIMQRSVMDQVRWNTISTEISGILALYPRFKGGEEFELARRAARRRCTEHSQGSARKHAIDADLLGQLRRRIRQEEGFYAVRDWSCYLLAYLGLFRASELVELQWTNVEFTSQGIRVLVSSSKTDQYYVGATVYVPGHAQPYLDLRVLLAQLRTAVPDASHVFTSATGAQLSADTFRSRLKAYLRDLMPEERVAHFSMHSFRRGGATAMAQQRVPVRLIKKHGRWLSDAVNIYLEAAEDEMLIAGQVLANSLF